jgi:hypothetical protein
MPVEMNSVSNADASPDFLNVSTTVGKNGVNHEGDVLLIQAMFYEVLPYVYGIPRDSIPYPTGTYDTKTGYLILQYQEKSSLSRGVKVWRDGFINRAVGSHVPGKKRIWTITYLNEDLYYVHASQGYEGDYVQWLINRYPELQYYAEGHA